MTSDWGKDDLCSGAGERPPSCPFPSLWVASPASPTLANPLLIPRWLCWLLPTSPYWALTVRRAVRDRGSWPAGKPQSSSREEGHGDGSWYRSQNVSLKGTERDVPGGPGAKTPMPKAGTRVSFLVGELDPACHGWILLAALMLKIPRVQTQTQRPLNKSIFKKKGAERPLGVLPSPMPQGEALPRISQGVGSSLVWNPVEGSGQ